MWKIYSKVKVKQRTRLRQNYITVILFSFPLVPPNIDDVKTSSDVIVNEGDDATLVCRAEGHPKPRIVWLREDRKEFPVYDRKHNNHSRRAMGE